MKSRQISAVVFIAALMLTACSAEQSRSTIAQQNLNSAAAQATNAAIDDAAQAAATQQARDRNNAAIAAATSAAYNATQQAVSATRTANDATIAALSVEQQRNLATAQAKQNQAAVDISINAATATAQAIDRKARIDIDIATRTAAETRATLTAVSIAADDMSSRVKSDLVYILPDILMRYAPCGVVLVLLFLALYLGRAIAARIAGDSDRAELALSNSILTVNFPFPLLPAPSHVIDGNSGETGNRETAETAGNSTVSGSDQPSPVPFNDLGEAKMLTPMTREEYQEFRDVRTGALELLARCAQYYQREQKPDNGIIPRFDKLGMQAERRGEIVASLEYSGLVSVINASKTFVVPEIGTCAALMKMIARDQRRVYPSGYAERRQQRLDDAVGALPELNREAQTT